jgi:hypothetical protein
MRLKRPEKALSWLFSASIREGASPRGQIGGGTLPLRPVRETTQFNLGEVAGEIGDGLLHARPLLARTTMTLEANPNVALLSLHLRLLL